MRVNPNPLPDLLAALSETERRINADLEQTASGQSVNRPSDDPDAAARLVQNAGQASEADQFLRSISAISGEMQNADSTLSTVITILQRAISLGTEGANGTLSAADRMALATEVQGIQSQMLSLANLSYQGNFVFAGTATQDTPYIADSSSPSGVRYVGNSGTNTVTVGNHLKVAANLPGDSLFSANGHDVFMALQDLESGLRNGSNIDVAVNAVNDAYQYVNRQRVFYGSAINQLSSQQNYLNSEKTQLAQQQNALGGVDLAKVLSDLVHAQTSRQATLEAIGKTQQNNLFDYLK